MRLPVRCMPAGGHHTWNKRMKTMKQITPLKKMSKKAQKAYYAQQRGSWNGLSPVTRIVPNKKVYDRKKARQANG